MAKSMNIVFIILNVTLPGLPMILGTLRCATGNDDGCVKKREWTGTRTPPGIGNSVLRNISRVTATATELPAYGL